MKSSLEREKKKWVSSKEGIVTTDNNNNNNFIRYHQYKIQYGTVCLR